jgi:ketoreductase RED2
VTVTLDLADRVVAVTGSTSGIGEAVARRLAACGGSVVVNSARSAAAGRSLAEELPDALYVGGDIADPGTAEALVRAAISRWGRLDGAREQRRRADRGPAPRY